MDICKVFLQVLQCILFNFECSSYLGEYGKNLRVFLNLLLKSKDKVTIQISFISWIFFDFKTHSKIHSFLHFRFILTNLRLNCPFLAHFLRIAASLSNPILIYISDFDTYLLSFWKKYASFNLKINLLFNGYKVPNEASSILRWNLLIKMLWSKQIADHFRIAWREMSKVAKSVLALFLTIILIFSCQKCHLN